MSKRVLIVDDIDLILDFEEKVIESVKSDIGLSIVIDKANTVTEAKGLIDNHDYDLIISDMNLPDGTGTEIAKYGAHKNSETRLAALTIYPQKYEMERAYFDAYFKKPILPSVFKDSLRLLLSA
ncbi:MAG: response regulator [Campylobacterota bacterium]